jgi:hypothetical protein
MTRFAMMLLCALPALIDLADADSLAIEPGQWKVVSSIVMNGAAMQPQIKLRCLSPQQAGDVAKTFGPVSGTVNSTCEPAEPETVGTKLQWHLQCKGQLDLDVLGDFNFDGPRHYSAVVISKGVMGGKLISDVKTEIEGERIGECQP